jgi:hypothetical protein
MDRANLRADGVTCSHPRAYKVEARGGGDAPVPRVPAGERKETDIYIYIEREREKERKREREKERERKRERKRVHNPTFVSERNIFKLPLKYDIIHTVA